MRVSGELLILDTDLASTSLRKSTLHIAAPVISLLGPLLPASAQSPTTSPSASIRTTAATFPSRSPDAIALDEASALRPTGADTKTCSEQHSFDVTSAAHLIARRVRRSAQQKACMPHTRYAADSHLLADPCRCKSSHAQLTNAASARQQTRPITTVDPSPSTPHLTSPAGRKQQQLAVRAGASITPCAADSRRLAHDHAPTCWYACLYLALSHGPSKYRRAKSTWTANPPTNSVSSGRPEARSILPANRAAGARWKLSRKGGAARRSL